MDPFKVLVIENPAKQRRAADAKRQQRKDDRQRSTTRQVLRRTERKSFWHCRLFRRAVKVYTVSQQSDKQGVGLLHYCTALYRQGNFARVGLCENDVTTLIYAHKHHLHRFS